MYNFQCNMYNAISTWRKVCLSQKGLHHWLVIYALGFVTLHWIRSVQQETNRVQRARKKITAFSFLSIFIVTLSQEHMKCSFVLFSMHNVQACYARQWGWNWTNSRRRAWNWEHDSNLYNEESKKILDDFFFFLAQYCSIDLYIVQ